MTNITRQSLELAIMEMANVDQDWHWGGTHDSEFSCLDSQAFVVLGSAKESSLSAAQTRHMRLHSVHKIDRCQGSARLGERERPSNSQLAHKPFSLPTWTHRAVKLNSITQTADKNGLE
jgi:hypothetical protein